MFGAMTDWGCLTLLERALCFGFDEKAIRNEGYSLLDRLRQMSQGNTIDVQSDHILRAIANLGFNESIDLT
jgi:hypothetical protein